ncbi:hypothetical protein K504DRAFT_446813 [Pleomassaria siparia CBS 279.74]|uniref:AAA+ ATPase domain-containing protein n=1 Tax=Pleomassaria siparia CBS 279.74 TaxID=1314801 RepID=A0A6G1K4G3_9PLEO|nr:hypothetical protein K504DRAFT_446813 [Pleomassaria siparia CBS 279.74]
MSMIDGTVMAISPDPWYSEDTAEGAVHTLTVPLQKDTGLKPPVDGQVTVNAKEAEANSSNIMPESDVDAGEGEIEKEDNTKIEESNKDPPDIVILWDSEKVKWALPYDEVKTWKQMKDLILKIQPWSGLSLSDEERKRQPRDFALVMLPGEDRIIPEHWEQLVRPGMELSTKYFAKLNWLAGTLKEHARVAREEAEKKPETNKLTQDVAYIARMYQEVSDSRQPDFLREKKSTKPIMAQIQGLSGDVNSVLHEVRNVFISLGKKKKAEDKDYDRIYSDDVVGSAVIQINSNILLNALKAIVQFQCPDEETEPLPSYQYYEDNGFELPGWRNASDFRAGRFIFPFPDLCFHIDELKTYKTDSSPSRQRHSKEYNEECDRHIDILLNYLYKQPSLRLQNAEVAWAQKPPVTTFGWLWLLFKPGSDVYIREREQLNCYVVESVRGMAKSSNYRAGPLIIKVWNLDFDGKKLVRKMQIITIAAFDGEREIRELPLFPTRFYPNKEGEVIYRQRLIQRGKTFINVVKKPTHQLEHLCSLRFIDYTNFIPSGDQEYTGTSTFHQGRWFSKSRVIVDHTSRPWKTEIGDEQQNKHVPSMDEEEGKTYLDLQIRVPGCSCAVCVEAGENAEGVKSKDLTFDGWDNINLDFDLTDRQYSICYSHVYAYCLQDRFWDLLDVGGLKPPRIEKSVIDTLVMRPASNKAMIKALCETYSKKEDRESMFFADHIRGKGEGQIILLHGPPGTGKTLTAESVAEYTERPLLGITAADLGHEPGELEKRLLRFFHNASKWDAIVLLDEADVYLERRSINELRRNSIVSIFLRALDYFQGILFLTTNRVGSFDEAFMSRIHIQIGYEPLDDDSRKQIWMNSFNKLANNHKQGGREIRYSYTAKEFVTSSSRLKELNWNGREIRNAFQTAVALACYEAKQSNESIPKLTEDHFSQVVDMSTNFKKYIKSALQNDEADLAYYGRLRDDRFRTGQGD